MNRFRIAKLLGKNRRKKTANPTVSDTAQETNARIADATKEESSSTAESTSGISRCSKDDADKDESVLRGHEKEEIAFYEKLRENAESLLKAGEAENVQDTEKPDELQDANVDAWLQKIALAGIVNIGLDDLRGRFDELRQIEVIVSSILNEFREDTCTSACSLIPNELSIDIFSLFDYSDLLQEFQASYKNTFGKHTLVNFQEEQFITDEAMSSHLIYTLHYLKSVGIYGSFKIKEIIALHRLLNQGRIMKVIVGAAGEGNVKLEDFPELVKRRNLLEFWRSCSDGEDRLSVNAKIVCLELESEFGREVRRKHPDVAQKIFPELVNRIIGQNVEKMEDHTITIFQLLQFVEESTTDGEIEEFSKTIDKLALEMFLTSALRSDSNDLILVAIKRIGKLLALRLSNLCALSHLLLNKENEIRSSAAERIIQISKEVSLRDKALVSFAELLESSAKRDRQCACLALGFLVGKECIPQLAYLYHGDVELEVREAASHSLTVLGDEGKLALEHAASTLLAQTNTQLVSSKTRMRLGTAL